MIITFNFLDMVSINPYLLFNGTAEAALNFYKSIFGGEFSDFNKFKDMPGGEKLSAVEQEYIMHIAYPLTDGSTIFASDSLPSQHSTVMVGNNFQMSISCESEAETTQLYNALGEGGRVVMKLEKTFWNAYFGMVTDKFGICWMLNYEYPNETV